MIDIKYDVRTDSGWRDPDKYSKTLQDFHKKLWSKKLPNWKLFELNNENPKIYLHHKSELWDFILSSDSIIHSYSKWKRLQPLIEEIPQKYINEFLDLAYTVWWFIIFPSNKINNWSTINQERWCNKKICDRFDLTLECIRLYYNWEESPLKETLDRYNDFFKLFWNFKWYCEYFLLQDLVNDDFSEIRFFLPFIWFWWMPTPKTTEEYYEYIDNNINFLKNRNKRMLDSIENNYLL